MPFGPTGDGKSCGDWDDNRTATQSKNYLDNWMLNFPEFNNNSFFIVGESYAGVYIPTLVRKLREDNSSMLYK
jgi:carboxypeptidase C (cathepsin A)